jgi:hypothetical protein
MSCASGSCTVKVTKADGSAFSSNATEWQLYDSATGKTLATPPGFGCDSYYSGSKSFTISFNPDKYTFQSMNLAVKLWSGGPSPCTTLYTTSETPLFKCQ